MKVSVLILTYNEERVLKRCVDSLHWCDDIVVLDSGSTDRTVEIANACGSRVFYKPFECFAAQRNYGLDHITFKHDWVLHLDADEVATDDFERVLSALPVMPDIDGYYIPSKLIFYGQWLKYSGMYPSYQVRLGNKDRLRFVQVGHGQREACEPNRIAYFSEPYLHYAFEHGMRTWLIKHVRYAFDEAETIAATNGMRVIPRDASRGSVKWRRYGKRLASLLPFCFRPAARFFYVYIVRLGFMDGRAGISYATMLAVYEGMIAVMLYEKRFNQDEFLQHEVRR